MYLTSACLSSHCPPAQPAGLFHTFSFAKLGSGLIHNLSPEAGGRVWRTRTGGLPISSVLVGKWSTRMQVAAWSPFHLLGARRDSTSSSHAASPEGLRYPAMCCFLFPPLLPFLSQLTPSLLGLDPWGLTVCKCSATELQAQPECYLHLTLLGSPLTPSFLTPAF